MTPSYKVIKIKIIKIIIIIDCRQALSEARGKK